MAWHAAARFPIVSILSLCLSDASDCQKRADRKILGRWVVFLSGLAHITLPAGSTGGAYVSGGPLGVIFAADTADVSGTGHNTSYPGLAETIALQVPTLDGEIPAHSVLRRGPCTAEDFVGLLGLTSGGS